MSSDSVARALALQSTTGGSNSLGVLPGQISLFSNISALTIPAGTNRVRTSGYATGGMGGADYIYDPAVNSAYVSANPYTSRVSANGRGFRLDPEQYLTIEMFGAVADYSDSTGTGTDNYLIFLAAIAFCPFSDRNYSARVHLFGSYYISQTVNAHRSCHFDGRGAPGNTGSMNVRSPTRIVAPTNVTTWVNHNSNTTDSGGSQPVGYTSAACSIYEGILFEQATQGTNVNAHAFWMRGGCTLRFCGAHNISGCGLFMNATAGSGGATEGNCNGWVADNFFGHTVAGDVLHTEGNDTNAGVSINLMTAGNTIGGCAIYDGSALGNHHDAPQASGYGDTGVNYAGNNYVLLTTDNINHSATTTPGTDNEIWYLEGPGSPSAEYPAYVPGTTYPFTRPILGVGGSNRTTVSGGYEEVGGAGVSHLGQAGIALGGGYQWSSYTKNFTANDEINGSIKATGDNKVVGAFNALNYGGQIYPIPGSDATYLDAVSKDGTYWGSWQHRAVYHSFYASSGSGVAPAEVARLTNVAFNLEGVPLQYNSQQVLGARKTGWATMTGTANRATWDTSTVTLAVLAETVKAMIDDFNISSGGQGFIGP